MESSLPHATSVGSITKKILEINPDLGVQDVISIVSSSLKTRAREGDFGRLETVDESLALELARRTLIEKRKA